MKHLLVLVLLLAGCVPQPRQTPLPTASTICLDPAFSKGLKLWEREAVKRFYQPILVGAHGIEDGGTTWRMRPPNGPEMQVEHVAYLLTKLYPGRPIILICCNPDGVKPKIQNVWYAHENVWMEPGPRWQFTYGRLEQCAGSIWDFQSEGR